LENLESLPQKCAVMDVDIEGLKAFIAEHAH
jgi:hypothetical protein